MEENFWKSFLLGIGCEQKEVKEIQGASGIYHPISCLGVDELKKRIIIVQEEQDARILAMVQADLQAKIKNYQVLMVRPVPINLATAVTTIGALFGSTKLSSKDIANLSNKNDETQNLIKENKGKMEQIIYSLNPQIEIIQKAKLNIVPIVKEAIQQLSQVKFIKNLQIDDQFSFDFSEILTFNPVIYDVALGICPIPLYNFSVDEATIVSENKDIEHIKWILKNHGIYQFFYPPADSLALGFIENNHYKNQSLISILNKVPTFGHPFGDNELIDSKEIAQIVDDLKEMNYVAEGEINIEITEKGIETRKKVKFMPRESIFKRISNILSIKIDLNIKDLFG